MTSMAADSPQSQFEYTVLGATPDPASASGELEDAATDNVAIENAAADSASQPTMPQPTHCDKRHRNRPRPGKRPNEETLSRRAIGAGRPAGLCRFSIFTDRSRRQPGNRPVLRACGKE